MSPDRRRPHDDELAAWRGFLTTHALVVSRLDAELRQRHGLSLDAYDVLHQLREAGGRLTMGELARSLLIVSPSSCTRLVDRLERDGLVRRDPASHDARVRHASLTPEGRVVLRRAAPTHLAGIRRWFTSQLTPDDTTRLAAFQSRVLDALPSAGDPGRSGPLRAGSVPVDSAKGADGAEGADGAKGADGAEGADGAVS